MATSATTGTSGTRRKRLLDDFDPHSLAYSGVGDGHELDAEVNHRRSSFHGMPSDFFSDVHSGLQANNLMKSRRLGATDLGGQTDDMNHAVVLGSLHHEVLAPLAASATGSPGPQPSIMNDTLSANGVNPFMPPSSTSSCFSTTAQLDSFRLDSTSTSHEVKETKSRVTKPVPKRTLHLTPNNTPRMHPPQLPALSQYLHSQDTARPIASGNRARAFSTGFQSPFSSSAGARPVSSWRPPSSPLITANMGSPIIGPSPQGILPSTESRVKSEVAIAFGPASDQCSSDEEFSMENEISLSQDKLNNLSVHDIADDLLEEDGENQQPPTKTIIAMELAKGFASTLTPEESRQLKLNGAYTVHLQMNKDPIVLGRDHFFPIFGDKIRGCETFHLSRKHCVFHVRPTDSTDASKPYKIVVENTSTNGLEVNGRPMKNLEQRELHVGDTVTLLKIRNQGVDISLGYTLLVRTEPAKHSAGPKRSPRTARHRSSSKLHLSRKPRTATSTNPFALPLSPPKKKFKFPIIHVNVVIADPFIASPESPRHPSRGYRDELTATMSAFSSIDRLKVGYEYATEETLLNAFRSQSKIVIYAGGCESNRLLVEDQSGMPSFVEVSALASAVDANSLESQLVLIFSKNMSSANLFVDAGFKHVIYINSSSTSRMKSAMYLKALLASLLIGEPVEDAHRIARRTTLGKTSVTPASNECLSCILPGGRGHNISIGCTRGSTEDTSLPILNSLLIPSLPPFFAPPEEVIAEIIGNLRKRRAQVCVLHGSLGIGKSSTAVYVAKYATDRRWYDGGVHYIDLHSAFKPNEEPADTQQTLGWLDDISQSDEQRQRISRRLINEVDELVQILHTKENTDSKQNVLIILDGCDRMNTAQFRDFIVKTLQAFPNVQILLTAREQMKINLHTKVVEEASLQLTDLSPSVAAAVFISMARLSMPPERLKKAIPSDSLEVIAKHPALTRLTGNPLLISKLVGGLKTGPLEDFA